MKKVEAYKSFDGKIFSSREECERYEEIHYENSEIKFLEHFKIDFADMLVGDGNIPLVHDESYDFFAVKITSPEDIEIYNNLLDNKHNDSGRIDGSYIGKTIIVSKVEEYYITEITIDELREEYEQAIEKLTAIAQKRERFN